MTLETKKEFIRYKIYMGGYRYDIATYHIAKLNIFDSIIEEIDEDSFYRTLLTKENKLSVDRFIVLLDHLVETMRNLFFNMDISFFTIENILEKDKQLMNAYFHYDEAIDNELNMILYRLIIINFISNVELIPCIESLLNENQIALKKYNEYSDKEVRSIIDLLRNIIFCNKGKAKCRCLFECCDDTLQKNINALKERRKNKYADEEYRNKFIAKHIDFYNSEYKILIDTYNKKKMYVKHFM